MRCSCHLLNFTVWLSNSIAYQLVFTKATHCCNMLGEYFHLLDKVKHYSKERNQRDFLPAWVF